SLGGREAKDLSIDEDLTAIVEERRRAMERVKEEEEHEAAIMAAKEHTMTSLGLKTGEKRRHRDTTSVDRMSIGDITSLLDMCPEEVPPMAKMQAQRDPVIGGYKTDEVYVYVRGRGRGRYVCDRCGIRCKKPSMLKKHIKSHTDVRPYQCTECNFSFKTKGNLTKHLASKAHRRKTTPTEGIGAHSLPSSRSNRRRSEIDVVGSDSEDEDDDDDDEGMEMGAIDDDVTKEMDINIDNGGSDDDFDELDYGEEDETVGRGHLPSADRHPYHKFGQEQILIERRAHTPPTCWVRAPERQGDKGTPQWPVTAYSNRGYCRRCTSAPPVVQTMKGEKEEEEEKGGEAGEKRRRDRRRHRKREGGDTRGNASAASSKGGEEKRGESGGGRERGPGTTVPGTVGLYAAAQQSDVQLSMTNATLSTQQAGRIQQQMNSSYSSCLLDVPKLASVLPPSASSLLTQGTSDQMQAAASLHPSTLAAARSLVASPFIPIQGQAGSSGGTSASTPLGYQLETEEMKCGECDRVFRKASDYTMHVHTHNLERSKMRLLYTCPECKLGHKSKQQLARHIEVAHPLLAARGGAAAAAEEIAARQRSSSSCCSVVGGMNATAAAQELPIEQTILNVTTNMSNNPRSFVCVDCNIGFRKHGILAKHLRSKTHVMKLETQKLLPEDSLTLITKRDNGTCLNEVDTTSCDTARRSILRIVDRIRGENAAAAASVQVQALPSQTNGPHSVDEQRRLVLPIAAPHSTVPAATAADSVTATAAAIFAQQQRGAVQPTTVDLLELLAMAHRSLTGTANTSTESAASAAPATTTVASVSVWMPPKAEEVQQTAAAAAAALAAVSLPQPTIQRRPSFDANGYVDRLGNGHSSTAVTPPALTRCGVCEMNFENPMDHQIHMMTDHIVMRDGHDFACPRPNCDKVYPNQESLRVHILAHFRQQEKEEETMGGTTILRPFDFATGTTAAAAAGKEEGEASASDEDTMEMEGGGEESSCPSRARISEEEDDNRGEMEVEVRPEREESRGGLACSMCNAPPFETAAALQTHWMTIHIALRPHVCTTCDASFTQKEQLDFHISTTHRQ
ncbi:hypothetical protein PENTCL1PPCAC_26799, partial [Pristionchus entomophagus]